MGWWQVGFGNDICLVGISNAKEYAPGRILTHEELTKNIYQ